MASRTGRPTVAVAMDGLWLGGLLVVLVAVPGAGSSAVVWAWAVCGGLSVVAGLGLLRSGWSGAGLRSPWGWWRRECAAVARATGLDMVLSQAFAQGTVFVVIAYLGLGAAGEYRAAQSLFGGCLAAMIALNMYALPRMRERGSSLRVVAWLGSRYLAVVAAVGAMTLLVNRPAQELVFGRVVVDVPLALATYALFVAMGLSSSQAVALRVDATSRQRLLLRSRSIMLVAGTAATVLATRSGSVAWVALAQAAGVGLFVVLTYAGLRPATRSAASSSHDPRARLVAPLSIHLAAVGTPGVDVLYCAVRGLSGCRPDRSTDLVVEGFPRSANTFVKAAFLDANPGRRVASHLHAARSVRRAVRMGVPTVVLVREPVEAVASLLVRDPRVRPRTALRAYLSFYRGVLPVAGQVVVAPFAEATRDMAGLVGRVNARFDRDFAVGSDDVAARARVEAAVEEMERDFAGGVLDERAVARPSASRVEALAAVRAELDRDQYAPLVAACRQARDVVLAVGSPVGAT